MGDTLLMSLRRRADLVAYCAYYEFEDLIAELAGADRFEAGADPSLENSRRAYKALRYLTGSSELAWSLTPKSRGGDRVDRRYDVFLPVFTDPYALFALAHIPDWRRQCRLAACYIIEVWQHQLPRYLLELLRGFDHIFLGMRHPVEAVAKLTGRPCSYLPLGADVMRFSPYPQPPDRLIDVCYLGRRSAETHSALMRLAADSKIFYYYDTVAASGVDQKQRTFRVQNAAEHRLLLANILKRSRYYVANRALANNPAFTAGLQEISGRFYEGVAAGAVIIGEPPDCEEFRRQFDWDDAVLPMPFDSPDADRLIAELDRNPRRLAAISTANFRNAALRHDWVYRLCTIYETLGLAPTDAMLARERRLQALAAGATNASQVA